MQISSASDSEHVHVHALTEFGKYHLIASLGQGGMAKVYLALLAGPADFNKLLVIKIMRQDALAGSPENMRMFWAEARLAARLLHPNIVHTHEVGEQDGRMFMAMEYLDGQPLSAILNRARADREIPLSEFLRVLAEVARGLHYAHQLKGFSGEPLHVVHRDISPQNIIVTYEGHGKLLDFGIAKTNDAEQTQLGLVKGKLDYIAPEQLRGEHIDARADVFALGAILWELLTAQRFAGGRKVNDVDKVQARLSGTERKLRALRPDVPLQLEQIVERAIAIEPSARFPDAASFADAIDAYLEHANLRPNARVLSARLHGLFERERADMHKLIDAQLTIIKSQRSEGPDPLEVTGTDARKKRPSGFGLFVADSHQDERSAISAIRTGARASTVAPHGAPRMRWWMLGSAAAAAAAVALWLDVQNTEHSQHLALPQTTKQHVGARAPEPEREAPPIARPTAPEPSQSVTFSLTVTPASATALIDGVHVTLPFSGSFRKDGTLHHVEVSAPGFRAAREFVPFDHDRALELALEPESSHRRGARLDQLVERAGQASGRNPESALVAPAQVAPSAPPPSAAAPSPHGDPVLGANPYDGE